MLAHRCRAFNGETMTEDNLSGALAAAEESEKPVQEVAETEEAKEAPEQGDSSESLEDKAEGEIRRKKPGGWHRKIARLERENAELAERLAAQSPSKAAFPEKKPKLEDYATYEEYNEALTDWKVEDRLRLRDEEQKKAAHAAEQQKAATSWQQKVDDLIDSDDAYEDYEDVVGRYRNVAVNPAIRQALAESEIGPKLAYYLAKNPDVFGEINDKTPYAVAKEMAKIEASLSNPKPAAKVSKSPPPITPVKGTGKTAVKLDALDTSSYIAQRYPHLLKK